MKNIVILGGGFGGLRTASLLSKKLKDFSSQYKVILVDRNDYQTYTPLLYEAATTSKETANYCDLKSLVTYSIPEIINGRNIDFIKDEVLHIDIPQKAAHLKNQKLYFEYLVLALG